MTLRITTPVPMTKFEERYFRRILEVALRQREEYEFVRDGDHESLRLVKVGAEPPQYEITRDGNSVVAREKP